MSDFGLFDSLETSGSEKKIASKQSQQKLAAAIYDVKDKYGEFLYAATALDEFHDRVALVKNDMMKTVDNHLMPVTSVMRRVVKACKDEWRMRLADDHQTTPTPTPGAASAQGTYEAPQAVNVTPLPGTNYINLGQDSTAQGALNSFLGMKTACGPYKSFDACVAANRDKDDPEAYCGELEQRTKEARRKLAWPGGLGKDKNNEKSDTGEYSTSKEEDRPGVFQQTMNQLDPQHNWFGQDTPKPTPGTVTQDRAPAPGTGGPGGHAPSAAEIANEPSVPVSEPYGTQPSGEWIRNPETSAIGGPNYTVRPGDTLSDIAGRAGVDVSQLSAPSGDPNLIRPGENITIPGRENKGLAGGSSTPAPSTPSTPSTPSPNLSKGQGPASTPGVNPVSGMTDQQAVNAVYPANAAVPTQPTEHPNIKGGGRRRADNTGPAMNLDQTYSPSSGLLIPEGDFKGYQDSVDQDAEGKVSDRFVDTESPVTRHDRDPAGPDFVKDSRIAQQVYVDWCASNRMRIASIDTLDKYAENLSDAQYFHLASAIHQAQGGKTNYLQKADEALTNVLNQKAEEFQQSISALQQALQVIQQAEQAEAQMNPMGVTPPAGTVDVLPPGPGGDMTGAGAGDVAGAMGLAQQLGGSMGGDPSQMMMGGGDPTQQMMANRRQAESKRHDLQKPGGTPEKEGQDDGTPKGKKFTKDWPFRDENQRFVPRS